MDFLVAGFEIAGAAKLMSTFEKGKRVGKKPAPLSRQDGGEAWSAALAVQFDAELRLQGDKPVAHALFRNAEGFRSRTDLPAT